MWAVCFSFPRERSQLLQWVHLCLCHPASLQTSASICLHKPPNIDRVGADPYLCRKCSSRKFKGERLYITKALVQFCRKYFLILHIFSLENLEFQGITEGNNFDEVIKTYIILYVSKKIVVIKCLKENGVFFCPHRCRTPNAVKRSGRNELLNVKKKKKERKIDLLAFSCPKFPVSLFYNTTRHSRHYISGDYLCWGWSLWPHSFPHS